MQKCRLINEGFCVSAAGDAFPCCVLPYTNAEKNKFTHDSKNFEFDKFWGKECNVCLKNEKVEQTSMMSRIEKFFVKRNFEIDDKRKYLDISFGNTCNLDCVMCSNKFSSKWNKIVKEKPIHLDFLTSYETPYTQSLSYEEIDNVIEILPDLKVVTIKGGEPLYDKKSLYFLDKMADKNITFRIVTNGVAPNWDIVKRIKNLEIVMSVDGIWDVYEWIRGSSFETIVENYKKFKDTVSRLSINYTVSAYNVDCINDTKLFFQEIDPDLDFDYLNAHEEYLHFRHRGKLLIDQISEVEWDRPPSGKERQKYKMFTNYMNKHRGFSII